MTNEQKTDHQSAECLQCGAPIDAPATGRRPKFCSPTCRLRHHREGSFVSPQGREGRDIPDSLQNAPGKPDSPDISRVENGTKRDNEKPTLRWTEINDVTWKLHGEEMIQVPAVHGKWPGFRVPLALGWLMNTHWSGGRVSRHGWVARVGGDSFGPTTIDRAKKAAEAMVNGEPLDALLRELQKARRRKMDLRGAARAVPLNLVGGYLWPGAEPLDPATRAEIYETECSGFLVDA